MFKDKSQQNKLNAWNKKKTKNRMIDLNPKIPVITLNIKGSKSPITR